MCFFKDTMMFKFCQQIKPISISLSPNTEKDDILLAFKLLFQPWKWKKSKKGLVRVLEEEFKKYLKVNYAISFNSGRSALLAILNSLGLKKGDEVLLQAFTCNALVNPILWSGLKPVFVDCDKEDFNLDVSDLKRKIGPKSKVVIVQHTFGLPAKMNEILKICRDFNLILIEDCAHSLGAKYKGKLVGTMGDASFFSFSRDKVISSVYGGMVATNNEGLAKNIKQYQKKAGSPSLFWIFQQLLHPVLMNWLILPTYKILGKYLLVLFQILKILSKAVHWKEKRGKKPPYFPKKMPEALALLALNQFRKLERFNSHRKKIANFYYQNLKDLSFKLPPRFPGRESIYLRFSIVSSQAREIIKKAWKNNLLIGDWYDSPIAPHDTKLERMQYSLGSCPVAEKLSQTTFNLPTHINISLSEAQKIIKFLRAQIKNSQNP